MKALAAITGVMALAVMEALGDAIICDPLEKT